MEKIKGELEETTIMYEINLTQKKNTAYLKVCHLLSSSMAFGSLLCFQITTL